MRLSIYSKSPKKEKGCIEAIALKVGGAAYCLTQEVTFFDQVEACASCDLNRICKSGEERLFKEICEVFFRHGDSFVMWVRHGDI